MATTAFRDANDGFSIAIQYEHESLPECPLTRCKRRSEVFQILTLSACKTQADINAAFLNAWNAIVSITPEKAKSSFNELKDSI